MLPTTIARGRATARGYGELLMLNPGSIPGLTAYRYSPYTIPTAAAGSAAAAAVASALANASATSQASVLTPTVTAVGSAGNPQIMTSQSQPPPQPLTAADQTSLLSSLAAASAGQPTTVAHQQAAAAQQLAAHQQQQQAQHQAAQQQQHQQQQQQQQLQQLQLLGLVGALNPHPHAPQAPPQVQPCTTTMSASPVCQQPVSVSAAGIGSGNPALAQMLAVNPAVAAASAAVANVAAAGGPCKARTLPTIAIENGSRHQPNLNGLNYSMNDLINLQGLQTFDVSAANFQVPVGL